MPFEVANGLIQTSGETLAHSSGKRRHPQVADISREDAVRETAGFNHWRSIFCRTVWNLNGNLSLAACERRDFNFMIAADPEICWLRWDGGLGIDGKQEFAGANPCLRCDAIFYYVYEHPAHSVDAIDGAQRGVDRVRCWNAVAPLVIKSCVTASKCFKKIAYSCLESISFHVQKTRHLFANKSDPGPIILIWIANIDVAPGDELFDGTDNFGALLA